MLSIEQKGRAVIHSPHCLFNVPPANMRKVLKQIYVPSPGMPSLAWSTAQAPPLRPFSKRAARDTYRSWKTGFGSKCDAVYQVSFSGISTTQTFAMSQSSSSGFSSPSATVMGKSFEQPIKAMP